MTEMNDLKCRVDRLENQMDAMIKDNNEKHLEVMTTLATINTNLTHLKEDKSKPTFFGSNIGEVIKIAVIVLSILFAGFGLHDRPFDANQAAKAAIVATSNNN